MIKVNTSDWPWMHYLSVKDWCERTFGKPADDSWGIEQGYVLCFNEENYTLFALRWE